MTKAWSDLHQRYKNQEWIDKPSIFAETAIEYFPEKGRVLELGAGQGQDSRFFASRGYEVTCTDLEDSALDIAKAKAVAGNIQFQKVDLREELPFESSAFDVVYAHLSLHYFTYKTTMRLFDQIERVLKPGGIFAFLVNSTSDPQYGTGKMIEPDYFWIDDKEKRYFSIDSTKELTSHYEVILLDNLGETYKDNDMGVHNLIRFVGKKPLR